MKPIKPILFLALFLFTFVSSQAQERFERLYPATDRNNTAVDIQQTSDGGYLMLTIPFTITMDSVSIPKANVTRLSPKGDIMWSKDYTFDEEVSLFGDLVLLDKDSFAFTTVVIKPGLNKIITKADPSGNVVWSKAYGAAEEVTPDYGIAKANLIAMKDKGFALFSTANKTGIVSQEIYGCRTDSTGNLVWANTYRNILGGLGNNMRIEAVNRTIDGGFILVGTANANSGLEAIFLTQLDSLGNIDWSRKYNSVGIGGNVIPIILPLPDKGYMFGGLHQIFSPGFDPPPVFLMRVDSSGDISWTRSIDNPSMDHPINMVNGLFLSSDSTLIIGGRTIDLGNPPSAAIIMEYDLKADTILWKHRYNKSVSNFELFYGELISTQDGGYAYYTIGDKSFDIMPYLLKVDKNGLSSCESDSLDIEIFSTKLFSADTFLLEVTGLDTLQIEEPNVMPYDSFSVPVLTLGSATFCPGEPIFATFDATVDGAVSYQWSTGETTPTITVTQEGQFTVDVRVESDVCFNLCDTAVVSVLSFPSVQIDAFEDNFCRQGFIQLQASGEGLESLEWSTGESNTSAILITEAGTYSVTATNSCGTATDAISIDELLIPPVVQIQTDANAFCFDGFATLMAFGLGIDSLQWSTGEVTDTIQVSDLMTYSVTAFSNFCGSTTKEINLADVAPDCNLPLDNCIQLPNAFTPNGDGTNDVFGPVFIDDCNLFRVVEFAIYSRWGDQVFSTKMQGDKWDGMQGGDPAPIDVYVWMLRATGINGKEQMRQGEVSLLR